MGAKSRGYVELKGCDIKEDMLLCYLKMMPFIEEICFIASAIESKFGLVSVLNMPKLSKLTISCCLVVDVLNIFKAFPIKAIKDLSLGMKILEAQQIKEFLNIWTFRNLRLSQSIARSNLITLRIAAIITRM